MKTDLHYSSYLAHLFLEWEMFGTEMFGTEIIEKDETKILWSVAFCENRAVYEVMWKIMVHRGRAQMTVQYGACAFMLDN